MHRRTMLGLILGAGLGHRFAFAQRSRPRVGFLTPYTSSDSRELRDAFLKGLAENGYIDGKTVDIAWRFADREPNRLGVLAADLVGQNVDLIVAETTAGVRAAKQATKTIPIVMTAVADAVGSGLVASLARPGGNVTGMSFLGTEQIAKRFELLKEIMPGLLSVAVLRHPGAHGEGTAKRMREETDGAAHTTKVSLQYLEVEKADQLAGVFQRLAKERQSALLVWPSPMFLASRKAVVELANQHRIPAIYYVREYVEAGGLISYGHVQSEVFRRSATHAARILKGAKPSDLPVEQPSVFELLVNMRTAKAAGIAIPRSILLRTDRVIE
jgi:ABC-type uncharacterized transport system substrate-binding protein